MELDLCRLAELPPPANPKSGPVSGRHAVTEQGIAADFLGDVPAWTVFNMIFDSVAHDKSPRMYPGGQGRSQV